MKTSKTLRNAILIALMSFFACRNHHSEKTIANTENLSFTLNIRESINQDSINYEFEDIFSEYRFIKLENHPDGLLKHIHNVVMYRDDIFISDRYNILQFDKHGKYVRRVGAAGKGPGEYLNRIVFNIDTLNQELFIKDLYKIIFYDLKSGRYKREFGFDKDVNKFFSIGNGQLAILTNELPNDLLAYTINEVYFLNRDGSVKDTIPNIARRIKFNGNMMSIPSAYLSGDSIKYVFSFNDTIYQINNDFKREPYALLQLHNSIDYKDLLVLPHDAELNHFSEIIYIANIIEYKNSLLLTLNKGVTPGNFLKLLYNKVSGEISRVNNFKIDNDEFQFWPFWHSNNVLIDYFFPYQLLDNPDLIKGENDMLKEIVKNMKDDDNPVLVLVK